MGEQSVPLVQVGEGATGASDALHLEVEAVCACEGSQAAGDSPYAITLLADGRE